MRPAKQLFLIFAATLFTYFVAFTWIEHRRVKNGPWQIDFIAEAGAPAIVISQPRLGIHKVMLTFPGAQSPAGVPQTILFDSARPVPFEVPFGQCVFLDTLSLPGNVTLKLFGHDIQLLPRMLTIDLKEQAWKSDAVIVVSAKP